MRVRHGGPNQTQLHNSLHSNPEARDSFWCARFHEYLQDRLVLKCLLFLSSCESEKYVTCCPKPFALLPPDLRGLMDVPACGVLCRCGNIPEIDRVLLCRSGCTFRLLTPSLSGGRAWCLLHSSWLIIHGQVVDHFRFFAGAGPQCNDNKGPTPVDLKILGSGIKLRVIFFPTNVRSASRRGV